MKDQYGRPDTCGGRPARSISLQVPLRIVAASRHPVLLEGINCVLGRDPTLTVLGIATSVEEVTRLTLRVHPDLVLTDSCLADGSAADLAAVLRYRAAHLQFVVLTGDETDGTLQDLVEAGLENFLHKAEATSSRILEAIHLVTRGEVLTSAVTLARLIRLRRVPQTEINNADANGFVEPLTTREHEVLRLMRHGLDNQSMARKLQVNYSTIRSHVHHILAKLDAHSQLEAVARASDYGLLSRNGPPLAAFA